jgi:c(7)-type cytochrome triheme protein
MSRRVTDRLRRAGLLAITLIGIAGCRSAAEVVFDLPEPTPETEETYSGDLAALAASLGDTVRVPKPAELTMSAETVLALLPTDNAGGVDWAEALRDGTLDPRQSGPGGSVQARDGFGFDFFFGEFETWFPHSSHAAWMACESCHPAIYRTRDIDTSMQEISEGESCGRCHGTVAFGPQVCERCHPQAGGKADRMPATLANDHVFTRDTTTYNAQEMTSLPPSIFPHWVHRVRYRCTACHPDEFTMRAGETVVTMDEMQAGDNCGSCHDGTTAFGVMECTRCHIEPPEPVVAVPPAEEAAGEGAEGEDAGGDEIEPAADGEPESDTG